MAADLGGFTVRRIAPSQDYIRRNGKNPKDGWAHGPAHPGPSENNLPGRPATGLTPQDPAPDPDPPPGATPVAGNAATPRENHERVPATAPFVHLHVHSNFSFLDGGSRIDELVARAAELGQPALALTDHDGLYGVVRLAKACAKHGIKPIFGAEVQVESLLPKAVAAGSRASGPIPGAAPPSEDPPEPRKSTSASAHFAPPTASHYSRPPAPSSDPPTDAYHLVLLAETREGYANLCRLISSAHLAVPGRDRPPTLTRDLLAKHREGLICFTGCRQGEVGRLVDAGRDADARAVLLVLREIFGRRHLFVELQHFGYEPHREATPGYAGHAVYQKVRGEDGRLRHHTQDPAAAEVAQPTAQPPCRALRKGVYARSIALPTDRPDLPRGRPQRLNPADYDAGFHRDGSPWSLGCLTYCDHLLTLAAELGLPTVLTTDAHYARPEDRALHLVCRAAGRDQPLSGYPDLVPGTRCLRPRTEIEEELEPVLALRHWDPVPLRSWNNATELAESGAAEEGRNGTDLARISPLDTPALIAERCTVDLGLGAYHFPQAPIAAGETAYSLLAKRCFRGLARMYRPVPPRAVELLEKELRIIEQMGFAHYFLVVHDIVRWARERGVYCSGRGSAGNSIVCYALDITASEPIRHHLLFERFLNPNRSEMPDIDVDFCSERRDEVIRYIYRTFGEHNVAVVANVNTMSPRVAVRIVAEALGLAPTEINALAKNVPRHGDAARLREYLAGAWPELRDSPLQDQARWGQLLDLAERLDGFPFCLGTHLGGFVIADRPITYYAPLQWAAKGVVVVQFNKDDVAALGLVKMDILGLRTHSAVAETVHLVRQRTGRQIRPYDLPPDDPAAYDIISNGGSIGLFQLESAGQRNLATRLQERNFDDVIAAIALYRPGPLEAEMIGPFIDRRWGLEPVTLPHPTMAEALADTYGVILYQEQVLRVAQAVAGFDPAEADMLRRAMTRDRTREEMARIGGHFVQKAVANGVPEAAAREVFRQLEGFAAYGFNKSHSVCFAVISYATAYLKAHYPAEFLCAVLNNQPMGFYTPRTVLNDARRFGLEVRPLDINLSGRGFTVEDATPPDPLTHDPFALTWDAAHDWGLTPADLDELWNEQNGESEYLRALSREWKAAVEPGSGDPVPSAAANAHSLPPEGVSQSLDLCSRLDATAPPSAAAATAGPPDTVDSASAAASAPDSAASTPLPGGQPALESQNNELLVEAVSNPAVAPIPNLRPGDLPLPHGTRARGGVPPGACLCPEGALAPDAGRALRVGLRYLKQMSERALAKIEAERRVAPFASFEDFYLRTRVEYPVAENLIHIGAFDALEPDRTELLWRLPLLHDRLDALAGSAGQCPGQLRAFFTAPERAGLTHRWTVEDRVRAELALLGLTVTCHPLQLYEARLRRLGARMSYELPSLGDEVPVLVAGVYERAQNPWMRSGKRTMFLTLEDAYGLFECVLFESRLTACAPVVARATYFLVRGRLQNNRKRGLAIVVDQLWDLEEVLAEEQAFARSAAATGDQAASRARRPPVPPARITPAARKRPPGAGTTAIPKKVG